MNLQCPSCAIHASHKGARVFKRRIGLREIERLHTRAAEADGRRHAARTAARRVVRDQSAVRAREQFNRLSGALQAFSEYGRRHVEHLRRFRAGQIKNLAQHVREPLLMTERETIDGARRRAMSIIGRTPRDTDVTGCIAVGVEGGLDPLAGDDEHYTLKSWAAATDGRDVGYGCGGSILMPDHIVRAVLAGCDLGDVIDDLAGTSVRGTRGAWGVLTRDLVGRRDSFTTVIIAALAPFYNTALYAR